MIGGTPLCRSNWTDYDALVYPIFNNYFQAPISEHGDYKNSYRTIKLLNLFVNDFGSELAQMQPFLQENPPKDSDQCSLRYAMRIKDESGYIFVNHHCHLLDLKPVYGVQFKVSKEMPAIPDNPIDITENPSFEYRDTYFRGAFDCDYAVKNRLNSSLALIPDEKGGRTKFYNFHHSFYDILPPDIYFDEHPEYYSLVDGVRLKQNGQLCLTNEDAVNEAIKRVKEWIRSRPDCKVFSVAQNDWSNNCTCPKCRETDEKEGSPSGSIIYFVNRIAEEIEKEYPDVLIHTFAYQYSRKAPKFIRPRDNVIVRLCNIECSWDENLREKKANSPESYTAEFVGNITDWGKISKHLYIWDYACNFSYYILPFPNYYILADNLRYYKECGVSGILEQGNFSYGAATGLAELEAYLCARLMWNTDLDVKELIMEFTDGVYGRSADYIRQYIELLCSEVKGKGLSLYYKPDTDFISEALINKADELFKKASNAAETAEIKERIEREYLSVRFLKTCWMPLGTEGRNDLIDELYRDVKKHGISEIQERVNLEISFERLRKYPFCREKGENYRLYYIMK